MFQTQIIVRLDKSALPIALEYNLDKRRVPSLCEYHNTDAKCLIIAQCLQSSYGYITRDSEIYPEYVVYYAD